MRTAGAPAPAVVPATLELVEHVLAGTRIALKDGRRHFWCPPA